MKLIKNQIAMTTVIILLLTYIFPIATQAAENKPIKTDRVSPFRKIIIKGNVDVVLIQRSEIGISYANDNEGKARITQQGDVLNITGTGPTTGKLIVYVAEIYRIEAEDNATVSTDGILATKFLQIILKGNANANIYTTSQGLYTAIYDQSTLYLKGNTDTHFLLMDKHPKLTFDQFAVLQTQLTK
ncbi:hypothetical protein ASE74_15085 [Pedobacter sp. Leaf216]|uniref:GIN domain-containing protein n=1 Tax=Pedobacter sp. Leaf216 TaxID=1735684 RepID=UPI0007003417|nr:DUF2807 domain-containing protein [Pedobacter sp. Leaf216]KQM78352.1 hypothetical protein ASE74_15085 [Pedobacter sp. Leaf216]